LYDEIKTFMWDRMWDLLGACALSDRYFLLRRKDKRTMPKKARELSALEVGRLKVPGR
jgi:hypothetical protein